MAWHPEKEGLLAFGTDEGKIGTVDALHSRHVQCLRIFHNLITCTDYRVTMVVSQILLFVDFILKVPQSCQLLCQFCPICRCPSSI